MNILKQGKDMSTKMHEPTGVPVDGKKGLNQGMRNKYALYLGAPLNFFEKIYAAVTDVDLCNFEIASESIGILLDDVNQYRKYKIELSEINDVLKTELTDTKDALKDTDNKLHEAVLAKGDLENDYNKLLVKYKNCSSDHLVYVKESNNTINELGDKIEERDMLIKKLMSENEKLKETSAKPKLSKLVKKADTKKKEVKKDTITTKPESSKSKEIISNKPKSKKVSCKEVKAIRKLAKDGSSLEDIVKGFDYSKTVIKNIIDNKTYKDC